MDEGTIMRQSRMTWEKIKESFAHDLFFDCHPILQLRGHFLKRRHQGAPHHHSLRPRTASEHAF
jgi:hypothetical protein